MFRKLIIFLAFSAGSPLLLANSIETSQVCTSSGFDATAIENHFNEIKTLIAERDRADRILVEDAAHNPSYYQQDSDFRSQVDGAQTRLQLRSDSCFQNEAKQVVQSIVAGINENCQFKETYHTCVESEGAVNGFVNQNKILDPSQFAQESMGVKDVYCRLAGAKKAMIQKSSSFSKPIHSCLQAYRAGPASQACLNSYNNIFSSDLKTVLSTSCTVHALDNAIRRVEAYMTNAWGKDFCMIVNSHAAMRQKYILWGLSLEHLDNEIAKIEESLFSSLQNGKKRSPAAICESDKSASQ